MSTQSRKARTPAPPQAPIRPEKLLKHGHTRIDPYQWLRERENPETIEYLTRENEYTAARMSHTLELQKQLFTEIKGRIKQTDISVPYRLDDYLYYSRLEEGRAYPIYCRRPGSMTTPEQIMLDVGQLAEGFQFYELTQFEVSSGQNILAYAFDTAGRRINTIRFKDLDSGEVAEHEIQKVTGDMAWANDNKTLFYTRQDPNTLRACQVFRHILGTDPSTDHLVFEELDETFSVDVSKTRSRRYLFISSHHTISTEYRYLDADDPGGPFQVFQPRQRDHEYQVDHIEDYFLIRTNSEALNFRLMKTPVAKPRMEHWTQVIAHREDVLLSDFEVFEDFLVLSERSRGLTQLRIHPWDGTPEHYLDFGEPAYSVYIGLNPELKTRLLRYVYSSMTTPPSTFDYDMMDRNKALLKQQEVLGGFDASHYRTERHYAETSDGSRVPISLVYRKGTGRDGSAPLLLYGYGSYGINVDASFSPARVSLLDRGFIFAIAHVRGGQEMGRSWYEDGKLLKKKNTFTDFIDCAEYLLARGYADPERLFAQGGSAGGLLMGAVMNLQPDLWRAVVAQVPYVDVVTTMLDDTIPLTTSEFDEWGNPKEQKYYEYMLSYSPYDNVAARDYPNLLVTTGLHDSQVQYWEPAKWVARLRALKTDSNLVLLKTNLEAGHSGASGRYKGYEETAFYYAFLIDQAGLLQHFPRRSLDG